MSILDDDLDIQSDKIIEDSDLQEECYAKDLSCTFSAYGVIVEDIEEKIITEVLVNIKSVDIHIAGGKTAMMTQNHIYGNLMPVGIDILCHIFGEDINNKLVG